MIREEIENLIQNKEFEKARKLILEDENFDLEDIATLKYLGLCNINLENFAEAYENFKSVIVKDPNDALSLYYISNIMISFRLLRSRSSSIYLIIFNSFSFKC